MPRLCIALLLAALAATVPAVRADVWDQGTDNDNDSGSDTELTHGLSQVHDLAAQAGGTVADEDWYRFQIPYATSWEILLDGLTGDVSGGAATPALELLDSDGTTVIGVGSPLTSFSVARHLTTSNLSQTPDYPLYLRVSNPTCGLACTGADEYRIRAYETTLFVPRYNNANSQLTVLVLQNNSGDLINGFVYAYGASGVFTGGFSITLAAYEVATFNLATVSGGVLNNTAGGLRIAHRAGYGQLTGKAVALEPATGFTFDTAVIQRPH